MNNFIVVKKFGGVIYRFDNISQVCKYFIMNDDDVLYWLSSGSALEDDELYLYEVESTEEY